MVDQRDRHAHDTTSKSGSAWTRAELKRVLDLYLTPGGKLIHEGNSDIQQLGTELGRTTRSLEAQLQMYRALDRGLDYSRKKMSRWCVELWEEHLSVKSTEAVAADIGMTEYPPPSNDVISHFRSFLPGGRFTRGRVPGFYVDTGLDLHLKPKLVAGGGYLAILSGNAGDGKTAFIEGIIEELGETVEPGNNVYEFSHDGCRYCFILDGSEETEDTSNDELLSHALAPYRDGTFPEGLATVVAVNKGTILGFLHRHRDSHAWLYESAVGAFVDLTPCEDSNYVFLDLNDRSLFSGTEETSLFGQMIERLLSDPLWATCESCPAAGKCMVAWNIEHLRKPDASRHLVQLLKCIDLDDRLHFTARHAVTLLLGTVLSGASSCAQTCATPLRRNGCPPFYAHIFGATLFPSGTEIAEALRELDPSLSLSPAADDLLLGAAAELRWDALGVSPESPELAFLNHLRDAAYEEVAVDDGSYPSPFAVDSAVTDSALLLRMLKRRAHFLGAGDAAQVDIALPFSHATEFNIILDEGVPDEFPSRLVSAINCAIGVPEAGDQGLIVPPRYTPGAAVAGWGRLIRRERIRVGTPPSRNAARIIEFRPREISMSVEGTGGELARLSISLMLFEMLMRAHSGFLPVTRSQKDYLARLGSFFDQINSLPQRRVGGELVLFSDGAATLLARQTNESVSVLPLAGSIRPGGVEE